MCASTVQVKDRQCVYNSIKEHSWNYCCLGKEIYVKYYECVLCILAEVIGHADHIFCAVLYCHLWPVCLCPILPQYLLKKFIEHKIRALIFSRIFVLYTSTLRRIQQDSVINVRRSPCKVSIILVRFWWNLNFLNIFSKKYSNIKFHEKSVFVGSELFNVDGQTADVMNLIVTFRNFMNAPKNLNTHK
jgi:hypothetical protein